MNHGGGENGNLACTYADFERFGIRRKSIAGAICELVNGGFLEVTHQGRGGNAVYRNASRYRLTYLATKKTAPTDDWKNKSPGAKTPLTPGAETPPTERVTGGENAPTGPVAKTPLLSISRVEGTADQPPGAAAPHNAKQAGGRVPSPELMNTPIVLAVAAGGVIPEVLSLLKGSVLENYDYLRALARLTPNDQVHSARRDLRRVKRESRHAAGGTP